MGDFEKELKTEFLQEAKQLLEDTEQCFLSLESNPDDHELLDRIFRLAHNLKGSSKAVGFNEMGMFTHEFESLLIKIKNGEVPRSIATVNLLLRCNDQLQLMVEGLINDLTSTIDSRELTEEVQRAQRGEFAKFEADAPLDVSPNAAIDPDDITRLLAQETARRFSAPTRPTPADTGDDTIRVSLNRLEKLLNFVGEMVILQSVLREQAQVLDSLTLRKTVHQLGKVSKEVQDLSMSLRMLPVKSAFQKMIRIVRDTSQVLGKKVTLSVSGEETEIDKTVLEHLGDPLMHIIRNAVDHGIESAEIRRAAGKPETGNVLLSAYHQGGRLAIEITDDGGGINTEVLKRKATEKGILRPGQPLTEREAIHLVFHPGFSTKSEITEVSGRGIGMDVVRTNIEKLSGEIQISTLLGQGTTFKIFLPLTLAIIDGMIIRSHGQRFVIPLAQVHESLRPKRSDIQFNTGFGEVLFLRGENLPLYRLGPLLGEKRNGKKHSGEGIAIVVRTANRPFAIFVDDIIGHNQVVIKQLGPELAHLKGFSGSAILGDGQPALILELLELIQNNVTMNYNPLKEGAA